MSDTPDPIPHARESAVEVLRSLEWSAGYPHSKCPICSRFEPGSTEDCWVEREGHMPDCRLAAAIATPSGDEVGELRAELEAAYSVAEMNATTGAFWAKSAETAKDRATAFAIQRDALQVENARLREALTAAEAALADIGDADREPEDDLAWCEKRAADALPSVRVALTPHQQGNGGDGHGE